MSAKQYAIPTPIQFDRLYAGPLDKYEIFCDGIIYNEIAETKKKQEEWERPWQKLQERS